jgi:hypothetical protein
VRSESEIREVADRLGQELDPDTGNVHALDWKADTFKFGFLIGKLTALGWVLGEPSVDLSNHYDFDNWQRELKEGADKLREKLG